MPRIVGVDVPKNKRIEYGLTSIFGIGLTTSNRVLKEANIDPNTRAEKLTDAEMHRIAEAIGRLGIKIEGDARTIVSQNIKRLVTINCYRGTRHKKGLPVRGQNTHANARTRKGPRRK
ncbi:MAG: 30S ribosomal protein S13 [uncultured bacterium]|nr:MAG: 30S ribosomal protein S13 [uncultured bacterium]